MNSKFESYFNRRYNLSSRTIVTTYQSARTVRKAIDDFESSNNLKIRSDGKLFLLLNFEFMVYRPLREDVKLRPRLDIRIRKDITTILKRAGDNISKKPNNDGISAHEIASAGLQVWESLSTLSKDSW